MGVSLLGVQRLVRGLPQEKLHNTPDSLFSARLPPKRVPNEVWLGGFVSGAPGTPNSPNQTSFGTLMGGGGGAQAGRQALIAPPMAPVPPVAGNCVRPIRIVRMIRIAHTSGVMHMLV